MLVTYILLALLIPCAWLLHNEIKHSERLADALCDVAEELALQGALTGATAARVMELAEEVCQ